MQIQTNNVPRHIIYGWELSEKERQEFDYLDDIDSSEFFRYKGQLYDLGEFMRIDQNMLLNSPALDNWQGIHTDSFFSAIVVRYIEGEESVVVGLAYS